MTVPDPMSDPLGYALYQELNSCTVCDGVGEDWDDGERFYCDHCEGTGQEPFYPNEFDGDR